MMATPDFVQVHMLTAYPAALLNRDDVGLAKRLPFGGSTRTRVSSQCLKKHWREAQKIQALGPMSVRSRRIYERLVAEPLADHHGAPKEVADAIAEYLVGLTLSSKDDGDGEAKGELQTGQVVVLTKAETDFLLEVAVKTYDAIREEGAEINNKKDVAKVEPLKDIDLKKAIQALPASLDTALFGRFVTSDLFARVDAAVSVAHAFTTHAEAAETDYFTAIDMLTGEEPGAGLIQDTEITTGVFYLYAVVDMNQLRDNLVGHDDTLAEQLVRNLVEVMATVSPGAKRGSTAPYSYAEFILVERGSAQPRTLANAFLRPVNAAGRHLAQESVNRLLEHQAALDAMYGPTSDQTVVATIHEVPQGVEVGSLRAVLDQVIPLDD